jgi:hypothetical protein
MQLQNFTQYYLTQAGFGAHGVGGIDPVYSTSPFLQKGHGIGKILWSLFRAIRPHFWRAAKTFGVEFLKTLGREPLRVGTNIVHDIAQNPQTESTDFVSRHVSEFTHNIVRRLRGSGRPRPKN